MVKRLSGQIPCCGVAILSVKEGTEHHTDILGNTDDATGVSKSNKKLTLVPKGKENQL